jgi:hypothetical protein
VDLGLQLPFQVVIGGRGQRGDHADGQCVPTGVLEAEGQGSRTGRGAVVPDDDRSGSLVLIRVDDDHRAVRVRGQVESRGPDQRSQRDAEASGTDHDEVGVHRRTDEDGSGKAVRADAAHGQRGFELLGGLDGGLDDLVRGGAQTGSHVAGAQRDGEQRPDEGVHEVQFGAA